MGLLEDGYRAFGAIEGGTNDGSQSCEAVLQVTPVQGGALQTFMGSTSAQNGHAEIHALYQFLKTINYDVTSFRAHQLTIECLAKACCRHCAAILGLLRAAPTVRTFKEPRNRGVSYSVPPDVRGFLAKFLGTTTQKIIEELEGSGPKW